MSTRNLAIVGLRLLAVYCFVESIPLFSQFVLMISLPHQEIFGTSESAAFRMALLPCGSLLLLAALLFAYSVPLARRLAPDESASPAEMACTFEQLQAIAFAVAGILILAAALPSLGRAAEGLITLYKYRRESGAVDLHELRGSWLYSFGVIAQIIIGLVLLLNPRGFRNIWNWLRTAGT
jgi:hypothetical protein